MNTKTNAIDSYVPMNELRALIREAFAIDHAPYGAVGSWLHKEGLQVDLHARLGTVMALPDAATVPAWACHDGTPWPQAGMRLLLPACSADGELRGLAASNVLDGRTAMPSGFSQAGLVVASPLARRAFAGEAQPRCLVIAQDIRSYLKWVELADQAEELTAVWGLLPCSWGKALADKVPDNCAVLLAARDGVVKADRLQNVYQQLQPRAANGDIELRRWPSTLRFA